MPFAAFRPFDALQPFRVPLGGKLSLEQQIAALFANDEKGAWYDPSDLSTLYTERTGTLTTPATVGGPVGTMLDKRLGMALGPELLGAYDFTSGWTASGASIDTITQNSFNRTATSGGGVHRNYLVAGKVYEVKLTVSGPSGGKIGFRSGSSLAQYVPDITVSAVPVTVSGRFVADHPNIFLRTQDATGVYTVHEFELREVQGNHATAPSDAARPLLGREPEGGRRNLLLNSENFVPWFLTNITVSSNVSAVNAPNGTQTADKLVETATTGGHSALLFSLGFNVNVPHTWTVYAKAAERNRCGLYAAATSGVGSGTPSAIFDLSTGEVVSTTFATADITSVGNGWYRLRMTSTGAISQDRFVVSLIESGTTLSYLGTAGSGIYVWGAQLEAATAPTPYQRVGASSLDVTEAGKRDLYYLLFNGTTNYLQTPSIDLTGDNKLYLGAALKKLTPDPSGGFPVLAAATATLGAAGRATLRAPFTTNLQDRGAFFRSTESDQIGASSPTSGDDYPALVNNVLSAYCDFAQAAGQAAKAWVNGKPYNQNSGTSVTTSGTFANLPFFIARLDRTDIVALGNFRVYGVVIRAKALGEDSRLKLDTYLAQKSGVTLL